jgi:hypothetical protein
MDFLGLICERRKKIKLVGVNEKVFIEFFIHRFGDGSDEFQSLMMKWGR